MITCIYIPRQGLLVTSSLENFIRNLNNLLVRRQTAYVSKKIHSLKRLTPWTIKLLVENIPQQKLLQEIDPLDKSNLIPPDGNCFRRLSSVEITPRQKLLFQYKYLLDKINSSIGGVFQNSQEDRLCHHSQVCMHEAS